MRRILHLSTVAVAATLAIAIAMGMGAGPIGAVAAQENATNATDDAAADDFQEPIDADTQLTDWSYSSGTFSLELEASTETTVAITEAGGFDEGTGSFNYDEVSLEEGSQTVTFTVRDRDGAAVTLATERSLAQGTGAFVATESGAADPFAAFGGESGLFSGVALTTGVAALSAAYVVRSEDSGVIEA